MNKELEALEKLTNYKCSSMSERIECKDIIETALNRLPELEKENVLLRENIHSLEELMKRPELAIVRENIQLKQDNDLLLINESIVRQDNKKLEEVLKIIKEKELDIGWFKQRFNEGLTYNDYMPQINPKYNLTETEFNLLKEYFK